MENKKDATELEEQIHPIISDICSIYSGSSPNNKFEKRIFLTLIAKCIGHGANAIVSKSNKDVSTSMIKMGEHELIEGRMLSIDEFNEIKKNESKMRKENKKNITSGNIARTNFLTMNPKFKEQSLQIIHDFRNANNGDWPTLKQLNSELCCRFDIRIPNTSILGKLLKESGAIDGKYPTVGSGRYSSIFINHTDIHQKFASALKDLTNEGKLTIENLCQKLRFEYNINSTPITITNLWKRLGYEHYEWYTKMTNYELQRKKKYPDEYAIYLSKKFEEKHCGIKKIIKEELEASAKENQYYSSIESLSKLIRQKHHIIIPHHTLGNILYDIGYSKKPTFVLDKEKARQIEEESIQRKEAWENKLDSRNPNRYVDYIKSTTVQANKIFRDNKDALSVGLAVIMRTGMVLLDLNKTSVMDIMNEISEYSVIHMINRGEKILSGEIKTEEMLMEEKQKEQREQKEHEEQKDQKKEPKKTKITTREDGGKRGVEKYWRRVELAAQGKISSIGGRYHAGRKRIEDKYPDFKNWIAEILESIPTVKKPLSIIASELSTKHHVTVSHASILKTIKKHELDKGKDMRLDRKN